MKHIIGDSKVQDCIASCLRCHQECLQTVMGHCLEQGGRHVAPAHVRLMIACAEICQAAANLMLAGSEHHNALCGVCADVCSDCAASCEQLPGMERCAKVCRDCAASCRQMSHAEAA